MNQRGFAIIPVLLIAVMIGLVGIIGWRVFDAQKASKPSQAVSNQSSQVAPITSKQDVEQIQAQVESAAIEADLDTTGLDDDLNSLL